MKKCNNCGKRERAKGQTFCYQCRNERYYTKKKERFDILVEIETIKSQNETIKRVLNELRQEIENVDRNSQDVERRIGRRIDSLYQVV